MSRLDSPWQVSECVDGNFTISSKSSLDSLCYSSFKCELKSDVLEVNQLRVIARVMAAAPTLLNVLSNIMNYCDKCGYDVKDIDAYAEAEKVFKFIGEDFRCRND